MYILNLIIDVPLFQYDCVVNLVVKEQVWIPAEMIRVTP